MEKQFELAGRYRLRRPYLFNTIEWWNLVPDQNHTVGTPGYDTPAGA